MNQFLEWANKQKDDNNLGYRGFADKVGMSHTTCFNILTGASNITWDFAANTAKAFNMDVVEAFKKAGLLKDKGGEQCSPASIGEMS